MTEDYRRSSAERIELLTSLRELQSLRQEAERADRLLNYRFDEQYIDAARRLFKAKFGYEPSSDNGDRWIQESNWLP